MMELSPIAYIHTEFSEKFGVSGRFCVIDQKTVWYGSVNFLGFSSEEDSVMRLADEEIAGRLIDNATG